MNEKVVVRSLFSKRKEIKRSHYHFGIVWAEQSNYLPSYRL
ncbi:hypothetical protein OGM63_20335 [Plectonema radiosum NIES-515]|uniref:Transposase n=1 Tax=Plectonema radiosum NIES-515 TaxID=2986073 RepID=A0ABT3B365_9CYAN|nr:hypothetical protein [Plectonema radiosum]MCV3215826.1 hypothetical protein [Plectonema radiosum NIES-515]